MAFFPFPMMNPMQPMDRAYRQYQENMMRAMAMGDGYMPSSSYAEAQAGCQRPQQQVPTQHRVHTDRDCFKIEVNVNHFTPDEISVKTTDKNVIVECKHEENPDDHGFVSRSFTRRYIIPDGAQVDSISSTLSSDGVLMVSIPFPKSDEETAERMIPIKITGVPAKKVATTESTSESPMEEK